MEPCQDGFELPSEDPTEVREFFTSRGWGDGLPVVVPTKARVDAFFENNDFDPDELVGIIPPRQGEATNRVIAINAVMAGCPSCSAIINILLISNPCFSVLPPTGRRLPP